MRTLQIISLISLALLLALPALADEMIVNGGFETGSILPWFGYQGSIWSVTTTDPHTGNYCAQSDPGAHLSQDFPPVPGNQISSASLWAKLTGTIWPTFHVTFVYSNSNQEDIWFTITSFDTWVQYDLMGLVRPDLALTGIRIYRPTYTHTFWLDDISIQGTPIPVQEVMVNGGFETGSFPPWTANRWAVAGGGHSGAYSAVSLVNGNNIMQILPPTPAANIVSASFWMKANFEDLGLTCRIYYSQGGQTNHDAYVGLENTWYNYTLTLNPDSVVTGIQFLGGWQPASQYWVDDVSILATPTALHNLDITLTPVNPPITIPAQGGNFSFNVTLTNNESNSVTFDMWAMVKAPNTIWFGLILGPVNNLILPSGASINRLRVQNVGDWAPAGDYLYYGYVGDYPTAKWDSSGFTFTKLGSSDGTLNLGDWTCTGEPFPGEAMPVSSLPVDFNLCRVSPNPFNPTTAISYQLSAISRVNLRVYDTAGRRVSELVEGWQEAGRHEVAFDGSKLASGVYLYYLTTGQNTLTGKMVLMK